MAKCHDVAQIITVVTELVGVSSLLWGTSVQNEGIGTNIIYNCKTSGTVHMATVLREVAVEFGYSWTYCPIPLVFFLVCSHSQLLARIIMFLYVSKRRGTVVMA